MDYSSYFKQYNKDLFNLLEKVSAEKIKQCVNIIKKSKDNKSKIYIVGNGGSASIASHVSVDFVKVAGVPSGTFNNANLITCFANDYGHDNWVSEAIKAYTNEKDMLILISSSGTSNNIVNAASYCNDKHIPLITLSGFKNDNPLSKLGNVNMHVESDSYNFIEMSHHIILLAIVDIFAQKLA